MYNLAVVGSRSFHDYELMTYEIDRIFKRKWVDDPERLMCIISGGARGADLLAKKYAKDHKEVHYVEYPADWKLHGKGAGHVRNVTIVKESHAVLAFWDGKSKGTKHTLGVAQSLGKTVKVVRF